MSRTYRRNNEDYYAKQRSAREKSWNRNSRKDEVESFLDVRSLRQPQRNRRNDYEGSF